MMAHQDVSEKSMERPLISVSLGCSAIFLMGTECRDTVPHAMLLRSGDVVFMTGLARQGFHSVPRIMEGTCPEYITAEPGMVEMASLRVNMNFRQVHD